MSEDKLQVVMTVIIAVSDKSQLLNSIPIYCCAENDSGVPLSCPSGQEPHKKDRYNTKR